MGEIMTDDRPSLTKVPMAKAAVHRAAAPQTRAAPAMGPIIIVLVASWLTHP